jgi:hypothetical protein
MAEPELNKGVLESPPARFAPVMTFIPKAMAASTIAAWGFDAFPGEGQEATAKRLSQNLIWGAPNLALDRRWVGGYPTFMPGYARWPNGVRLATGIQRPDVGWQMTICRTLDPTIATSSTRAFVCGDLGSPDEGGYAFEFSHFPTGQARAFSFAVGAPTVPVISTVITAANALGKWRIWFSAWGTEIYLRNLSADGSQPSPGPLTLTGGHRDGEREWTVGGRGTAGVTNYDPAVHKDIVFHALGSGIPATPDIAALNTQGLKMLQVRNLPHLGL